MPALILDTATERGFVAIVEGVHSLFHVELPLGLHNAQFLLPEIQNGLQKTGFTIGEMAFVAVGIGPGSYTGIRVGATVAKTLAFACHLPLIGVCSLTGFQPDEDGEFAAVVDAKVGGVYLQVGRLQQGVVFAKSCPMICQTAKAAEILSGVDVLVTPKVAQLKSKLEAASKDPQWKWQERSPTPRSLAMAAMQKFYRGEFTYDTDLDLLYMRKTQAEIEREVGRGF